MATEMWFQRKMQRILQMDRKTNEKVFQKTHENCKFIKEIRRSCPQLLGHVMSKN